MNYDEFSQLTRSQKVTLAVIKAKQRLKNFTFVSGTTWTRLMPYYVSNVTGATYSYDVTNSILTIISVVNPNTLDIIVEYSFFFSDFPINKEVEYQARLIDIGALKLEIDSENVGIAIESDSSIKLENTDGYFDAIFDTLIWENQECLFYSWSPLIPWSDKKLIYRGYINTKTFNDRYVTFSLKDTFVKLRERLPTISRLVYGRVKNIDCISTTKVGTGYALSGTLSGVTNRDLLTGAVTGVATTNVITGTGTLFTTELIVGDKIRIIDGVLEYSYTVNTISSDISLMVSGTISNNFSGAVCRNATKLNNIITGVGTLFLTEASPNDSLTVDGVKYKIASIESNTSLTTDEQIKVAFTSLSATNLPEIPYREKNRTWNISGHLLGDHSTTVVNIYSQQIIVVNDIGSIQVGDKIAITTSGPIQSYYTVARLSGNVIFLNQSSTNLINIGDVVYKPSIQNVALDTGVFVPNRDYIEDNTSYGCNVIFNDLAEFNVALEQVSSIPLAFTNGSRTVTSLSTAVDLTSILKPRDWIKPYSGSVSNWYEVLSVDVLLLTIRNNYSEARNYSGPASYKIPNYIADESAILIDCYGKKTTEWLGTASDVVLDLCNQVGLTGYNTSSFSNAKIDAPYCISLAYPDSIGGTMPIARDAILTINKSVLGSLYSNSDFNISYSILNADRDASVSTISDDDIISFTTMTKNQIVGSVTSTYRKEIGASTNSTYTYSNGNIQGIATDLAIDLALYNYSDAVIITQRYAFLRSGPQTLVTIKGKLNLITKSLNDRVYLNLQRLFKRFGSTGSIKVGLVNMSSKDSSTVDIQVNDVGNMFSRVSAIAPDTASDYSTSSDLEKSLYGYITDNNNLSPDASVDTAIGANLIG